MTYDLCYIASDVGIDNFIFIIYGKGLTLNYL